MSAWSGLEGVAMMTIKVIALLFGVVVCYLHDGDKKGTAIRRRRGSIGVVPPSTDMGYCSEGTGKKR